MKKINNIYSIIKGNDNPLSSDVAIIKDRFVFEVGNGDYIIDELNKIDDKIIAISHFHQDHIANLNKLEYKELYIGDNTYKYTNKGTIIDKDLYIDDVHLFKINSCHAKGSIGLEISDYAFVGDALAPCLKKNQYVYNVQMLKEEIETLENLKAKYLITSHHMEEYQDKNEIIDRLKKIYETREKNNSYIKA